MSRSTRRQEDLHARIVRTGLVELQAPRPGLRGLFSPCGRPAGYCRSTRISAADALGTGKAEERFPGCGRSTTKAPEDRRTPKPGGSSARCPSARSVVECACPLALYPPGLYADFIIRGSHPLPTCSPELESNNPHANTDKKTKRCALLAILQTATQARA